MLREVVLFLERSVTMVGDNQYLQALLAVVIALVAAKIIDLLISLARRWAKGTKTEIDDLLFDNLHQPLFMTMVLIGLGAATLILQFPATAHYVTVGMLRSILLLVWVRFVIRFARQVCQLQANRAEGSRFIRPATLHLFDNLILLTMIAMAIFFLLQIWDIHIGAWVASAGVVGLALSFAAKDSLANLFAGVFIIADAPYRVGDFVVLDDGSRGRVTHIGLRSTRLLTRDDIEIVIPNSVMGNSKIVNQTGGPFEGYRTKIPILVSYGEDLDKVRDVLMEITECVDGIAKNPAARVRFRRFDDSGISLDLMCWMHDPALRGKVTDDLIMTIHRRFREEGIQFPYPRREVYVENVTPGREID